MKCLHDSNTAISRGLCMSCYQAAWKRVEAKEVTWEKLEKLKLVKPAKGHTSAFTVKFKKVMSVR